MLKKITENPHVSSITDKYPTLIWVCAWCPKEKYPALLKGEEYTHGMCRKHYAQIRNKRSLIRVLGIAELFENALDKLDRSKKRPHSFFSQTLKYLELLKTL
jgi:hypothetical protein